MDVLVLSGLPIKTLAPDKMTASSIVGNLLFQLSTLDVPEGQITIVNV